MRETAAELKVLQALDPSHKRTGPHMKSITDPSKYALSAMQVVKLLEGMKTVAVAAPAPNGAPLVERFRPHQRTAQASARVQGRSRSQGDRRRFQEALLRRARSAHAKQMSAARPRDYGGSAFDWSDEGVHVRLDADHFYTHSRTPKDFPS